MRNPLVIAAAAAFALAALTGCSSSGSASTDTATDAPADAAADGRSILYEVESDGETASVTWMSVDGGSVGQQQDTAAALPWSDTITVDDGLFSSSVFSLVAQASETATTITCRITVDGEVVSEQTSQGAFSVATCSGSSQ